MSDTRANSVGGTRRTRRPRRVDLSRCVDLSRSINLSRCVDLSLRVDLSRTSALPSKARRPARAFLFALACACLILASFTAVALLLTACAEGASARELPRGEIVDNVAVEADPRQTYALYLPASYTADRSWPIVYAFDPVGRGRLPVELLRAAAERFGYVVVGSNNSRNGLAPAEIERIVNALWADTHARLSLDAGRTYAAGFSGGARVANRLALACRGCVAGVISCGAGLPVDARQAVAPPYAFFGTVGVDDFNFREMRTLARRLDALGATHRLATFEGRHRWCPEEVCAEGLEWMELLAMRAGRRAKDDALIDAALARLRARAEGLKRPADAYEKYALLKSIAQTFEGLRDVSGARAEAESVRRTKEFQSALSEEERQLADEQRRADEIVAAGGALLDEGAHAEGVARIERLLAPLREAAALAEDTGERRVARRTLAHVYAGSLESAQFLYEPRGEYALAAANLELAAMVYPTAAQTEFELARALALGGRKGRALEALARAVEKGYGDADAAAREAAFAALRPDKKFQRLLERMKAGSAKQPDGAKGKN